MREADELLIARYLSGDEMAFTQLYRRWWRFVYKVVFARCGGAYDRALVEDLTQEAWLWIAQRVKAFDPTRGAFSTFARVCTRSALRAYRRHWSTKSRGGAGHTKHRAPVIRWFSLDAPDANGRPLAGRVKPAPAETFSYFRHSPLEYVLAQEARRRVCGALAALPLRERKFMMLRLVTERPLHDVAKAVRWGKPAALLAYHTAMAQLYGAAL